MGFTTVKVSISLTSHRVTSFSTYLILGRDSQFYTFTQISGTIYASFVVFSLVGVISNDY